MAYFRAVSPLVCFLYGCLRLATAFTNSLKIKDSITPLLTTIISLVRTTVIWAENTGDMRDDTLHWSGTASCCFASHLRIRLQSQCCCGRGGSPAQNDGRAWPAGMTKKTPIRLERAPPGGDADSLWLDWKPDEVCVNCPCSENQFRVEISGSPPLNKNTAWAEPFLLLPYPITIQGHGM